MTLSFTTQNLRDKLGNTIQGNYAENMLSQAVDYGISQFCAVSHTIPDYWDDTNPYWGSAVGIGLEFATAWVRSTQINVSIQMTREYNAAVQDAQALYGTLLSEGLIKVGKSMFVTEEFTTDVLNPVTGTSVTGLHGIVRRNRLLNVTDPYWVY